MSVKIFLKRGIYLANVAALILSTLIPTDTETLCTALMFYKEQILLKLNETVHVDFHFVVVKELDEPYLELGFNT